MTDREHAFDCPCMDCEPRDEWLMTSEPATPLYIGPLQKYARRMLFCLDRYWSAYEERYDFERLWWEAFERYREKVEGEL